MRPKPWLGPLLLAPAFASASACRSPAPPAPPARAAAAAPSASATGPGWALDRSTFDPSTSPCDDFYQHVCGGWIERTAIAPDRPAAYRDRDLIEAVNNEALRQVLEGQGAADDPEVGRLRTFYSSCMNRDDEAGGANERTLGRWLTRIGAVATRADLQAALRELHAVGVEAFFDYTAEPDPADATRYRGNLDRGALGLRLRNFRDPSAGGVALRAAYREHVERMLALAGADASTARREAGGVVELEQALAAASPSGQDAPDKLEHATTPAALGVLVPHVDWAPYLALVGHPAGRPLNVTSPAYLRALEAQLATRPIGVLRAYLRWRLLHALGPALPARLADEHVRFRSGVLEGLSERPARASECRLATLKGLGVELSRQFSRRFVGPEARERAEAAARGVQAALVEATAGLAWLSPAARAATARELEGLLWKIGYPDAWPATGDFALDGGAYLDNVLAARAYERRRSWARVGAARTRESWEMTVYPNDAEGMAAARLTIVNGFPDLPSNSIILPAASLRPPLFDAASPPEVRYGAFGSLVAHELVHALEHYAYEGDRARRPLWAPGDFAAHKARHRCVAEQASGFVAAESARLDGERTLDENVADLGGVTYAYRAMARELGRRVDERGADGLTAAQRFFVSYAQGWCEKARPEFARDSLRTDPHAPARFRVNGPLANVPEFAAAFSCPAKANMVRPAEQRCSVW